MRKHVIIAGERRCGTTSLYAMLRSHPGIRMHSKTDFNYFVEDELDTRTWFAGKASDINWTRTHDPEAYWDQFPSSGDVISGHKGADLLFWRPVHVRLRRFVPNAQYIVILRDPVKRAWSHYWNEVGKGRETLSFSDALAAEEERCNQSDYAYFHLAYRSRGNYAASIEHILSFIPRENILFLTMEEMFAAADATRTLIAEFLRLDCSGWCVADSQSRLNENATLLRRRWAQLPMLRNLESCCDRLCEGIIRRWTRDTEKRRYLRSIVKRPFRYSAKYVPMSAEVVDSLSAHYRPLVLRLETLLDRSLSHWKSFN